MPHVLIVDDEPGIRFALKRWFERQHWTVAEAGDGQQAFTMLLDSDDSGASRIDVVVCDLHLPTISGEDLLRRLAVERPDLAERVILSTGDAVDNAPPGSAFATHPYVLQKPFDLASLRALVLSITAP
ncbi:MAG: response regulator [Gemmatimonadota bacterium]|nr:response regulator [Gemmatimonadota bacterium]MDQ8172354.1 response regulator [Gemmatimonadota bacterium]